MIKKKIIFLRTQIHANLKIELQMQNFLHYLISDFIHPALLIYFFNKKIFVNFILI